MPIPLYRKQAPDWSQMETGQNTNYKIWEKSNDQKQL